MARTRPPESTGPARPMRSASSRDGKVIHRLAVIHDERGHRRRFAAS